MSNRSLQALHYNISVIGLSGVEDVRGSVGVGKSCLCNRFVRPNEDSFYSEHIYMLSQTDFGGEVVNNVPWLYWGETVRQHPETDQSCVFRIIEQTEFIDDTAFTVLSFGSHEPYPKRCLNLKLKSARKLVYICKDQLGLEEDFQKDYLPEGKITIDGFVYAFDVSDKSGLYLDSQFDCLREVLQSMPKIHKRRPFIIATTKNDCACDAVKSELERFLARREIRNLANNVTIVETSAVEGVNVDSAFMMIASMIEKSKTKPRTLSYVDAARIRHEETDRLKHNLQEKMLTSITSHRTMWREWSHRHNHSLQEYCSVLGTRIVERLFDKHVHNLRQSFINTQRKWYLSQLPKALDDLLSSREAVRECTVSDVVERLRQHERFDLWFIHSSDTWDITESADRGETRIPVSILRTDEGKRILLLHSDKLEEADTRNERRKEFLSLLRRKKSVKAGKSLADVSIFLTGESCFDRLSAADRLDVYSRYQDELKEKSQAEFHELLLERADLFFRTAMSPMADEEAVLSSLQEEAQFRNLGCMPTERRAMVRRHLSHFRRLPSSPLCSPPSFQCPASPCVQSRLFDYLSSAASVSPSSTRPLVVLGEAACAQEVAERLRETVSGLVLELHTPATAIRPDVRLWSGSLPPAALLLLVYRDARAISMLEQAVGEVAGSGCPCVVLHLTDVSAAAEEKDLLKLRGGQLACQVDGVFAEIGAEDTLTLWQRLDNALNRALLAQPKLSVVVAFMCSDLYPLSLVIGSIQGRDSRCVPWKQRLYIGEEREVLFMSYFQLLQLLTDQLPHHVHGLVLVFWTARRASLASMKAVCNHTPVHWPKLVLGVGVDGREEYLQGGRELAHEMEAHFAHIQPDQMDYRVQFEDFLRTCSNTKVVTEDRNRQLMGASSRRPANHPSTLPPTPVSSASSRVQRRKSSAGSVITSVHSNVNQSCRKSWHSSNSSHEDVIYSNAEPPSSRFQQFSAGQGSLSDSQETKKSRDDRSSVNLSPEVAQVSLLSSSSSSALFRRGQKKLSRLRAKSSDNLRTLKQLVLGGGSKSSQSSCSSSPQPGLLSKSMRRRQHKRSASAGGEKEWSVLTPPPRRQLSVSPLLRDVVASMCQSHGEEEIYCSMYEDISASSPAPTELAHLNSNSSDAIYAEPLDIHALSAANPDSEAEEDGRERTTAGGQTLPLLVCGGGSGRTQPFSDGESEYAEVEGFEPGQDKIQHIRICQKPPAPYPRSTSEVQDPWERRERHLAPEYDEPACDVTQDDKLRLLDHPEFVRHTGERRSHKESKKKAKTGLTSSKSFGAGDGKKSQPGRGWRSPFRSAAAAVSPTRAQRSQDSSPRSQPRSQPSFVAACTEYVEKHGLKSQGIYRQCGNRNVAEMIRQRSKDGHISDWLESCDFTPHDVATALKLHLRDLPEPLFALDIGGFREIAALPTVEMRLERLRKAIFSLPPLNQRLLYHLLHHLHKVTAHSGSNDMTATNLAICWTPTLAVPHTADVSVLLSIPPMQEMMALLIDNAQLVGQP